MNLYCSHPVIDAEVYRLLGEDISRLLREGKAQEISVNADGRIRIDDGGPWEYLIDAEPIPPAFAKTAIRLIAAASNIWIDPAAPFIDTMLACGARFSASTSPISDGVQLTIRAHARIFRPLTAFMTAEQAEWTRRQIAERKNARTSSSPVRPIPRKLRWRISAIAHFRCFLTAMRESDQRNAQIIEESVTTPNESASR